MKTFMVSYELGYVHRVSVGIRAADDVAAKEAAARLFDAGTIWDDTPEVPLLYDDYEETNDNTLVFTAKEVPAFPAADASVASMHRHNAAHGLVEAGLAALRALEDGALPRTKRVAAIRNLKTALRNARAYPTETAA